MVPKATDMSEWVIDSRHPLEMCRNQRQNCLAAVTIV